MHVLFICISPYQVLNALNIKQHLLYDTVADICVEQKYADRIIQTGLFRYVFYIKPVAPGLHDYLHDFTEGKHQFSFIQACTNQIKEILLEIKLLCYGPIAYLEHFVDNYENLKYMEYDQIIAQSNRDVINNIYQLVKKKNPKCLFYILDEGVGSYVRCSIGKEGTIADGAYLYEPDMITYDENFQVVQIPKIKRNNIAFIKILNYVFDYRGTQDITLLNGIVLFDQAWGKPMPKYLQNMSAWKRFIFANAYKKHLRIDRIYHKQIELFKKVVDYLPQKRAWIKFHPHSMENSAREYEGTNIETLGQSLVPWEVICCNSDVCNNIFVTINSTAVCSSNFVLDMAASNNKMLFLFRLSGDIDKGNRAVDIFLQKYEKKYPGKVLIPSNESDWQKILPELKAFGSK